MMATKTMFVKNWLLLFCGLFVFIVRVIAFLDIDEINSVHYGIEILKEPVLLTKENLAQSVQLKSKFGQQYQCNFPDHNEQGKLNEEVEKVAMETGIPELLRPLAKRPCLSKTKDWWSYEFCYGRYIRQYHMEDHKPVGDIIYLGYFESEFNWENTTEEEIVLHKKHKQNRYHSQRYINGTKCDLKGEGRKTEVRFMCDESNGESIYQIDEPETCVYVLTVYTSLICHHPYLKAPTPSKPISITCNPVLAQDQYNAYLQHQTEENERKKSSKLLETKNNEIFVKDKEFPNLDLGKSLKFHLTSSPEEAAAAFKEMLSLADSSPSAQKDFFSDDDKVFSKDKLPSSESHNQEKQDPQADKTDEAEKQSIDDTNTEFSTASSEAASPSSNTKDADNQNDLKLDDEFTKELNKEISEAREHFVKTKEKLHSILQAQFKDLLNEAEDVLLEEKPEQRINQLAATKKLAKNLNLLNILEKTKKEISEAREHFVKTKEKLHSILQAQFKDLLNEAEDVLLEEKPEQRINQLAATKKLAKNLNLLNILEKTKKELKLVNKAMEEHKNAVENIKLKFNDMSSPSTVKKMSLSTEEDDSEEKKEETQEDSITTENLEEETKPETKESETRIKVRVTKIRSVGGEGIEEGASPPPSSENGGDGGGGDGTKIGRELHVKERQDLEESVKEALGGKLQLRIITAGYYDSDDDSLKVLLDEDTTVFKNMIVAILGGNDEVAKETERHKQLEENYSFVWQKNGQSKRKTVPK